MKLSFEKGFSVITQDHILHIGPTDPFRNAHSWSPSSWTARNTACQLSTLRNPRFFHIGRSGSGKCRWSSSLTGSIMYERFVIFRWHQTMMLTRSLFHSTCANSARTSVLLVNVYRALTAITSAHFWQVAFIVSITASVTWLSELVRRKLSKI